MNLPSASPLPCPFLGVARPDQVGGVFEADRVAKLQFPNASALRTGQQGFPPALGVKRCCLGHCMAKLQFPEASSGSNPGMTLSPAHRPPFSKRIFKKKVFLQPNT